MGRQPDDKHGQSGYRRSVPAILAVALVATLFVGGTFAYFTRESTASTEVALDVDNTEVEVINSWNEKNGAGGGDAGLQPGERVNDTVLARNVGDSQCYLRIRMRITKGGTGDATGGAERPDPAALASLEAPAQTDLNAIVGTFYSDPFYRYLAGTTRGVGLQPTAFTPTPVDFDGPSDAANVLSSGGSQYTRATLTSAANGAVPYGYVANTVDAYGTSRSYVADDGSVVLSPTDGDVRSAAAYNTRLGTVCDQATGAVTVESPFRNVTTQREYAHGLLTFEYVANNGLLSTMGAGASTSGLTVGPLFTTVCVPWDSASPTGGTDADSGDPVGYTVSFWAESVPASDFESMAGTAGARRLLAMDRLDSIYPATTYYSDASAA